jgi:isopentenyl-diphosphate Delta-isomerase
MEVENNIILVNENDEPIGASEKLEAHQLGKLHRAFSIFIFNSKGELLLQKRASSKYHSGGLWSNTCCSHPRVNEDTLSAAHRRLQEEMGLDCDLKEVHKFVYKIKFDNGLTEYEYDHVLVGKSDEAPKLNLEEVEDWKWVKLSQLCEDVKNNPENFTSWLKICLNDVLSKILEQ